MFSYSFSVNENQVTAETITVNTTGASSVGIFLSKNSDGPFSAVSGVTATLGTNQVVVSVSSGSATQNNFPSYYQLRFNGNQTVVIQGTIRLVAAPASNGIPLVPGIADGQYPQWNAASSTYIPGTPQGNSEFAYAENGTGTATGPLAATNGALVTALSIPLTDIVVNPTTRPIYLDGYALLQQTTAGGGFAMLEIWDTTGTPAFYSRGPGFALPNSINASIVGRVGLIHPAVRVGPVVTQRTFNLRLNLWGTSGPPAVSILNTNTPGFKSWLRALAA